MVTNRADQHAPVGGDDAEDAGPLPWDSDGVDQVVASMLDQAGDGPLSLGSFSDEELAGVDSAPDAPRVPMPWLESLTDDEREVAVTGGLRSLTIRGVYEALPLDPDRGTIQPTADPEIWALLALRRRAVTTVVAERATTAGTDWIVLHGQPEGVWLGEFITIQGFHDFVVATEEHTRYAALAWCGAHPALEAPEFEVELSDDEVQAQPAVLEPVGQSTIAVTVAHRATHSDAPPVYSGVYTGGAGGYLSTRTAAGSVRFAGASAADLDEHWRGVLIQPST